MTEPTSKLHFITGVHMLCTFFCCFLYFSTLSDYLYVYWSTVYWQYNVLHKKSLILWIFFLQFLKLFSIFSKVVSAWDVLLLIAEVLQDSLTTVRKVSRTSQYSSLVIWTASLSGLFLTLYKNRMCPDNVG